MQYYVALCSSLKLLSLESILRIQQQIYDVHVPTHTILTFSPQTFGEWILEIYFCCMTCKKEKKTGKKTPQPTRRSILFIQNCRYKTGI